MNKRSCVYMPGDNDGYGKEFGFFKEGVGQGRYRVLGDLTRVRILMTLVGEELCVRDIASGLELTDSAVSHQLRILRNSRLVKFRKDGKNVLYSISDEHVATIFREGLEHVEEL